jgi:hypothetical protein
MNILVYANNGGMILVLCADGIEYCLINILLSFILQGVQLHRQLCLQMGKRVFATLVAESSKT